MEQRGKSKTTEQSRTGEERVNGYGDIVIKTKSVNVQVFSKP